MKPSSPPSVIHLPQQQQEEVSGGGLPMEAEEALRRFQLPRHQQGMVHMEGEEERRLRRLQLPRPQRREQMLGGNGLPMEGEDERRLRRLAHLLRHKQKGVLRAGERLPMERENDRLHQQFHRSTLCKHRVCSIGFYYSRLSGVHTLTNYLLLLFCLDEPNNFAINQPQQES